MMNATGPMFSPLQAESTTKDGAVDISVSGVALAAALIFVQGLVSVRLSLGLHSQLAVAGVRCVVQLALLGYILVPIFTYNQAWLVLAYAAFMVWISAVEAIGRPARTYRGMFLNTLIIIAVVSSSVMGYALTLVLRVSPWWSPQYLIPILGMLLGNTISGISVGLAAVMEELSSGADRIERLLSLGASRSEACAELLARSLRLAMTPLLNQMSVVGLVSIPGMMTGQILGGSNPDQAARYQMVIMFLLGAASCAAAVASTSAAVYHVVDGCHRLRPERLLPRGKAAGVNGALTYGAQQVWELVVFMCKKLLAGLRWCCCCMGRLTQVDGSSQQQPEADSVAGVPGSSSGPSPLDEAKQPLLQQHAQQG